MAFNPNVIGDGVDPDTLTQRVRASSWLAISARPHDEIAGLPLVDDTSRTPALVAALPNYFRQRAHVEAVDANTRHAPVVRQAYADPKIAGATVLDSRQYAHLENAVAGGASNASFLGNCGVPIREQFVGPAPELTWLQRMIIAQDRWFGLDERRRAQAQLELIACQRGQTYDELRQAMGGMSELPIQMASKFVHTASFGIVPDMALDPHSTGGDIGAFGGTAFGMIYGGPGKAAEKVSSKIPFLQRTEKDLRSVGLTKEIFRTGFQTGMTSLLANADDVATQNNLQDASSRAWDDFSSGAVPGSATRFATGTILPTTRTAAATRFALAATLVDAINGQNPLDERPWYQKIFDYGSIFAGTRHPVPLVTRSLTTQTAAAPSAPDSLSPSGNTFLNLPKQDPAGSPGGAATDAVSKTHDPAAERPPAQGSTLPDSTATAGAGAPSPKTEDSPPPGPVPPAPDAATTLRNLVQLYQVQNLSQQFNNLSRILSQTGSAKKSPQTAQYIVTRIAEAYPDSPLNTTTIKAGDLVAAVRQSGTSPEEFAQRLPEQARALEATEGDPNALIPISLGTHGLTLAETPLGEAIEPHLRPTGGKSSSEAASELPAQEQALQQAVQRRAGQIITGSNNPEALRASCDAVARQAESDLLAAGIPPEEAARQATAIADAAVVAGNATGITPEKAYQGLQEGQRGTAEAASVPSEEGVGEKESRRIQENAQTEIQEKPGDDVEGIPETKWARLELSSRHFLNSLTVPKRSGNSIFLASKKSALEDLAEIRAGKAKRNGEEFTVSSGRVWKIHGKVIYPVSGNDIMNISPMEYNILVLSKRRGHDVACREVDNLRKRGVLGEAEASRISKILRIMEGTVNE